MKVIRGDQIEFVPASHEDPANPGVLKRVLATKNQLLNGRVQMVNWARLPAGRSFQPHYHEDMQEVFIILNGTVTMQVSGDDDGTLCELRPGDAVLIEPREIHQMSNLSKRDVDYLVFGISTEEGGKTVNAEIG